MEQSALRSQLPGLHLDGEPKVKYLGIAKTEDCEDHDGDDAPVDQKFLSEYVI